MENMQIRNELSAENSLLWVRIPREEGFNAGMERLCGRERIATVGVASRAMTEEV